MKIKPRDPNVRRRDVPALAKQSMDVYVRLLEGPASVRTLEEVCGGRRVCARVWDINQFLIASGDTRRVVGYFKHDNSRTYIYKFADQSEEKKSAGVVKTKPKGRASKTRA